MLEALAADVGRRFGADHRVLTAGSPGAALGELLRLAEQREEVALVVAGQMMAELPGVLFLLKAHELHPSAKRVLLVGRREWSPTNPAVRAMTLGQIDTYLFEPWLPVARFLDLPICQVLADWQPSRGRSFEGIRIVGPPLGSRSHELRDMLTRMGIPHGWYQPDSAEGRRLLEEAGQGGSRLPVLVFHSGQVFVDPSDAELAEALGYRTSIGAGSYDLVIAGAGPAGLAAAVYAASEGLDTLVVEPQVVGGQAGTSAMIRNYLGFPRGISGMRLAQRARNQAIRFGTRFFTGWEVTSVGACEHGDHHVVRTDGGEIHARTVVVATGVHYRKLGIEPLERLVGQGVFYGSAMSAARELEGQDVVVVGGGNSAGQAAIHLARFARSVTILVRRAGLEDTMSRYLIKEVEWNPRVSVRPHSEICDGGGDGRLDWLDVRDRTTEAVERVEVGGLFLLLGAEPHCDWLPPDVARDEHGFVLTGRDVPVERWGDGLPPANLATTVPGVTASQRRGRERGAA
ncbi:MAG: FAD-dependent oxidoreductase, partial [Actinomycetota bacterium]